MSKSILIPVAHGSEEIEIVCLADTLRRAEFAVTLASVETELTLNCSRKVKIEADCFFADVVEQNFDLIVIPGGVEGSETLSQTSQLTAKLKSQHEKSGYIAAMCAAPAVVFARHYIAVERLMTAHPAFFNKLHKPASPELRVVVDKNCITSQAPGTAIEFALVLIELLAGRELAEKVAQPMLVK
ncbi:DJ-1/PfpI family protein [Catenovulum sp. 2E275]|uniref:DJ-1 family glyoxalase III n=1 Tax=Catenovulum sp. 2E275 TaxID=2980497 RepID=UPI0021CE5A82|nr:DJ-1 family glyoxalase III [Catenovulum sp. 2E275]MCU4674461.1 DJ-1/PfpI family protein [Catenovulum sp. 2E275]